MRNLTLFGIIIALLIVAIILGRNLSPGRAESSDATADSVPHIGRVQLLNGCGIDGIAWRAADVLRKNGFDVKNDGIGNAETFNYPATMVISRTKDMTVAQRIGKALRVEPDKVMLIRTPDDRFDVTVILGADIEGKLR
jgi:hypothetical protein